MRNTRGDLLVCFSATSVMRRKDGWAEVSRGHNSFVDKYLHLFDLIDHVAYAVVEQDDRIVPATNAASLPVSK